MFSRRSFLAQMAAAGLLRGAAKPWKLAIGLNGFGSSEQYHNKKYDYDEILAFARDEGFEGIEAWRNWRGGYPDPEDTAAVRAMREKVESYGLQIFSIQAGGPRRVNPVSDDDAARRKYTDALKRFVDLSVKLGCEAMGLWPPGRRAGQGIEEDLMIERFAVAVKPAAEYAVDKGIFIAIEGEPPLLINQPSHYHKLFAAVGMKEFKVIFDPSHFDVLRGGKGKPEILLKELGVDRVGYIQFCDGDGTLRPTPQGQAGTSRHLACGAGVYDIPGMLEILYEGGFRGW
ncbi:MAG: sugar phosphate isomerase/epimerase, partial [bacterium]|nr:sugar phosphate isomerase/epimerase [bacterium]